MHDLTSLLYLSVLIFVRLCYWLHFLVCQNEGSESLKGELSAIWFLSIGVSEETNWKQSLFGAMSICVCVGFILHLTYYYTLLHITHNYKITFKRRRIFFCVTLDTSKWNKVYMLMFKTKCVKRWNGSLIITLIKMDLFPSQVRCPITRSWMLCVKARVWFWVSTVTASGVSSPCLNSVCLHIYQTPLL